MTPFEGIYIPQMENFAFMMEELESAASFSDWSKMIPCGTLKP